jgi:hypothetical protein
MSDTRRIQFKKLEIAHAALPMGGNLALLARSNNLSTLQMYNSIRAISFTKGLFCPFIEEN